MSSIADDASNPYAPTLSTDMIEDVANERLKSVSRIFVWIGLLGTLIYVPVVIGCVVALIANIAGRPISEPKTASLLVLVLATALNGALLVLWLTFIITARQIWRRKLKARNRALVLSVILMLCFPILTIPGIFCYRWIRKYLTPILANR